MIHLRIVKSKRINEKTYTIGDTQYWKRNGKCYKWTQSQGKVEISEDDYYKALSGGTSGNDKVKNTDPANDKTRDTTKSSGKLNYSPEMTKFKNALGSVVLDSKEEYHRLVDDLLSGKPMDKSPEVKKLEKALNQIVTDSDEEKKEIVHKIVDDALNNTYTSNDKAKKYKDMYAKATADYERSLTKDDKEELDKINKHSARRSGEYMSKLYHDVKHPNRDDSESDYIKYNGVSDFDHTTWDVNGMESTIVRNPYGRGYYLHNEDYDEEFDTKADLINFLKSYNAELQGYDSENDY